jgi:protein-export membrane protein SecD
MGRKHKITLLIIAALVVFCVSVLAVDEVWGRQGMSLGLDLEGGTHLVYDVDFSEVQPGSEGDAIEVARGIIEKRINRYGVSESTIQIIGDDRISVQIPGVTAEEAKALVGTVAELDFREMKGVGATLTEAATAGNTYINVSSVAGFSVNDTFVIGISSLGMVEKEYWEAKKVIAINGTNVSLDSAIFYDHQFSEPVSAWIPATGTIDEEEIHLTGKYLLPNCDVSVDQLGKPVVAFEFNAEGARLFSQITERLLNKPLGIFLDNDIISAPTVQAVISDKGIIEGVTFEEAKLLSSQLNGGALPLPLGHWEGDKFLAGPAVAQTVDATLGADSLHKSLIAGIVGAVMVLIFMIAYYRLPGLLACVALLLYSAVILTIFKLVPVTMTLASIAAFVLSIGMAVDANVLIFERLKEEMRAGKPLGTAVELGFSRAWPAIRDSNVTTLITCIILYWFGSRIIAAPLVMGFALTLGIGVVVSMFSALIVTRIFLRTIVLMPLAKKGSLYRP